MTAMTILLGNLHARAAVARAVFGAVLAATALPAAAAFQIAYTAFDLDDVEAGKDLWRYDYVLTGHDFAVDDGVEFLFPKTFFTQADPVVPAQGWDFFAMPDEPLLPDAAVVAAALEPLTSPRGLSVQFVWLGGVAVAPGSQQFRLYVGGDVDNPITGATTAAGEPPPDPIPEPGSIVLLLAGLCALAAGRALACTPAPRIAR